MKIAVIGLGYVGLPLSLQFARSCTEVIGIDVDSKKVELLNKGQSYIKHISADGIREMVDGGKFSATTDFSRIREVEAVIICVPTPLTKHREPDISYIIETGRSIAPYLKSAEADLKVEDGRSKIGETGSRAPHPHPLPDRGGEGEAMPGPSSKLQAPNSEPISELPTANSKTTVPISELPSANSQRSTPNAQHPIKKLVVLESTTYPGTTDEDLRGVLEEGSGTESGERLSPSPFLQNEKYPGNSWQLVRAGAQSHWRGIPRRALEKAMAIYGRAVSKS